MQKIPLKIDLKIASFASILLMIFNGKFPSNPYMRRTGQKTNLRHSYAQKMEAISTDIDEVIPF